MTNSAKLEFCVLMHGACVLVDLQFLKEHTQRYQVPAWKPPGSLPLLRIVAYDADVGTNAEIQFALAGRKTENERYKIDPSTGEIFALQPLKIGEDYEVVVRDAFCLSYRAAKAPSLFQLTTCLVVGESLGSGRLFPEEDAPHRD